MGSSQQALLDVSSAAAAFTPADLSPLVWLDPTGNATYSGSNLSTASNAGSVGGSFSITGTIAKTTSGSLNLLTLDNISKRLNITFAIATGTLCIMYAGKLTATGASGVCGILGQGWPGGGAAKANYINVGTPGDCYLFANACCAVDSGHSPSFYSVAGGLSDTSFHTMVSIATSTTNVLYKDAVSQTLTSTQVAAMPSTGSVSWDFGVADTTSEPANANIAAMIILSRVPTATEVSNFHTYYNSRS